MPSRRNLSWPWVVPLILLTFWLAVRTLDDFGLSPDEFASLQTAGGAFSINSVFRPWEYLRLFDPWHVPGYFMILNIWSNAVGWSEFTMRILSLLLGLLGIAWTYRLAYDVSRKSRLAALAAAAILALSPIFTYYLRDARMYSQLVALTAFTLWLYRRIMFRSHEPGLPAYIGLLAGATGLIYTHYFGLIPLIIIGITHLTFFRTRGKRWWLVIGVMLLAGILFIPWLSVVLEIVTRSSGGERAAIAATPLDIVSGVVFFFSSGIPLLLAFTALLTLGQRGARLSWLWLISALIATILINDVIKAVAAIRYLIYFWPILAVLAGLGIAGAARQYPIVAKLLLAGWIGVSLYVGQTDRFASAVIPNRERYPFHLVRRELVSQVQQGDGVAFSLPVLPYSRLMDYYLDRLPLAAAPFYITPGLQDFTSIQANLTNTPRLWLAYKPGESPADYGLSAAIPPEFRVCSQQALHGLINLELLARDNFCCDSGQVDQVMLRFGDGIALVNARPLPEMINDNLSLLLRWSVADWLPLHTYSVSLQIVDREGAKVAQSDYELNLGTQCYFRELSLANLPEGTYSLLPIVYNWQTGERLPAVSAIDGQDATSPPLASFSIAR